MNLVGTAQDQSASQRRYCLIASTLILLFATVVRCLDLGKSLWCDEADSLIHSQAADFIASARQNVHPPLYFWLLRQFGAVAHTFSELRLLSVMCGVATVALMLRAIPHPAALLAGLVAACSPELVYQSQELRQYALLCLVLMVSLLCTLRLSTSPDSRLAQYALALSLVLAAATHLTTGFFMVPLAVLLLWSHKNAPWPDLSRLALLFAPAACLLVFLSQFFLSAADRLGQANWWMAPATWPAVGNALSAALGWDRITWLARALGRHLAGGELVLMTISTIGVGFVLWSAWTTPLSKLTRQLLLIALGYWAGVIIYSFWALSILMPRIMVPGVLPFLLAVATGIFSQPSNWRRRGACIVACVFALGAIVPWLWFFAWQPREDLRGLVTTIQEQRLPNELTIFVGGTRVALDAYWPQFKDSEHFVSISILEPLAPQLDKLRNTLDTYRTSNEVLVVYRMDGYFYPRQSEFAKLLAFLAQAGFTAPHQIWDRDFYYVLRLTSNIPDCAS